MHVVTTRIQIGASKSKLWEIVFKNFGDTYKYNPLIAGSQHFAGNKGELGCERQCDMDNGQYVRERIDKVEHGDSFEIDIYSNPMKIIRESRARFDFREIGINSSEVIFAYSFSTRPGFVGLLMKSMMKKMFFRVLIGLKHYAETGEEVQGKDIRQLIKQYT